jgi:hypothetical protein
LENETNLTGGLVAKWFVELSQLHPINLATTKWKVEKTLPVQGGRISGVTSNHNVFGGGRYGKKENHQDVSGKPAILHYVSEVEA